MGEPYDSMSVGGWGEGGARHLRYHYSPDEPFPLSCPMSFPSGEGGGSHVLPLTHYPTGHTKGTLCWPAAQCPSDIGIITYSHHTLCHTLRHTPRHIAHLGHAKSIGIGARAGRQRQRQRLEEAATGLPGRRRVHTFHTPSGEAPGVPRQLGGHRREQSAGGILGGSRGRILGF